MTELSKRERASNSHINKNRCVFWDLVRFARQEPYCQKLSFWKEDVHRFGGTENSAERQLPSIEQIQLLSRYAMPRERLWIWMAIGLGFGQKDLSYCRWSNFDAKSYDLRGSNNNKERYGEMPPLVWAMMQEHLGEHSRKPDERMFLTANGLPLVREVPKTEQEMRVGTLTRPPSTNRVKRIDAVGNAFNHLKRVSGSDYGGSFCSLRHLGATAFADRHKSILRVHTFLGHGKSDQADRYMKPLPADMQKTVNWVNEVLQSSDALAWENDLKEFTRVQEWRRTRRGGCQKGKKHHPRRDEQTMA